MKVIYTAIAAVSLIFGLFSTSIGFSEANYLLCGIGLPLLVTSLYFGNKVDKILNKERENLNK